MARNTVTLQLVNLFFSLNPLTRWYAIRSKLLRFAGIDCHPSARIVASCRVVSTNVAIGIDSFVGHQTLILGNDSGRIVIGNYVDIAPRVVIVSGTHAVDMLGSHSAGKGRGVSIWIQDGVWIGANSTVTAGVTIGKKSVIGAGSVVVSNIPPFCVAVGNPCKPVKQWSEELKSFEKIE